MTYKDHRGVIEDVLLEQIDAVSRIISVAGAVRGNHYHKETRQWTYIVRGNTLVVSSTISTEIDSYVAFPGDLIYHAPGELHAFKALSDSEWLVFTKGPRKGEDYETDTFRLEKPLI